MERLAFRSRVALRYHHATWEEKVIEIPETDDINPCSDKKPEFYNDAKPTRSKLHGFESVSVSADDFYTRHSDHMLWIPGRSEWVVIRYHAWMESEPYYDDSFDGPYGLGIPQAEKILEAFCIPGDKVDLGKVAHTSPDVLQSLSVNKL